MRKIIAMFVVLAASAISVSAQETVADSLKQVDSLRMVFLHNKFENEGLTRKEEREYHARKDHTFATKAALWNEPHFAFGVYPLETKISLRLRLGHFYVENKYGRSNIQLFNLGFNTVDDDFGITYWWSGTHSNIKWYHGAEIRFWGEFYGEGYWEIPNQLSIIPLGFEFSPVASVPCFTMNADADFQIPQGRMSLNIGLLMNFDLHPFWKKNK